MSMMNAQTVRRKLKRLVKQHGMRGLCRQWSVDPGYLSRVVNGKMEPGKQILDALGLYQVTSYRTKDSNTPVV